MKTILYLITIAAFFGCTNPLETSVSEENTESEEVSTNTNVVDNNNYYITNNTSEIVVISFVSNYGRFSLQANSSKTINYTNKLNYKDILLNGVWCNDDPYNLIKSVLSNKSITIDEYDFYYKVIYTYNNGITSIEDSEWDQYPNTSFYFSREVPNHEGIDIDVYYKDVLIYSDFDMTKVEYTLVPDNYRW